MIINNVYNESKYLYKNNIEDIICKIEDLREELDNKLILGINNDEEILELSEKLDELIVEYFKISYKN